MKNLKLAIILTSLIAVPVLADEVFIDVSGAGNAGTATDADTLTSIFNQMHLFADTTTTQFDTVTTGTPGANPGDRFLDTGHAVITDLLPPFGDDEGIANSSEITVSWTDLRGHVSSELVPVGIDTLVQTLTYEPNNVLMSFYFHDTPNSDSGAVGSADNLGFTDGDKVLEMKVTGGHGTNTFSNLGEFLSGSSILDGEIVFALNDFWYFDDGNSVADPGTDDDFHDLIGLAVPIVLEASVDQNTDKVLTDFSGAGLAGPAGFGNQLFQVHSTHDGSIDFSVAVPEPKTLPFFALGLILMLIVRRKLQDTTPTF